MQRVPLKDLQADIMQGEATIKRTPDKCRDQAASAMAAKLLNSAKKSLSKHCAKKVKLSLQKTSTGTGQAKASARTLSLSPDLNDTMEFKTSVSMKSMPKLQLVTKRKRKKPCQDDEDKVAKNARQDTDTGSAAKSYQCPKLIPEQDITELLSVYRRQPVVKLQPCSAEMILTAEESCESPPPLSPEGDPTSGSVSAVMRGDSETDSSQCEREDLSSSLHTCPACNKMLQHGKFVRHIQQCLEKHYHDEDQAYEEMPKDHNTEPVNAAELDQRKSIEDAAESLSSDYVFCQLCQKDLSHLNSHRRQLHINRCIDEEEEKKAEEAERQRALEAARTQVLDCPMCGKDLRTASSRKIHLKKCASSQGVGPDQLLSIVRRQEEEHLATLAAGILPARPGRSTRQNPPGTHRGIGRLPKSKLDEDTQLALALSSSLRQDTEEAGTSTAVTTAGRRGRKNKQEEDYLLLKLSQSQAAGRIEARVSDLITKEADQEEEEEDIPPLPPLNEQSLQGQTVQWTARDTDQQCTMFWRLSSLEHAEDREGGATSPRLLFYVSALMPPVEVSSVAVGSKIRRMSEIPGRRRSLESAKNKMEDVLSCDKQADQDDQDNDGNLPPFSTQTAALLADMAAEADGIDSSMQLDLSHSSEISGDVERQVQQDLMSAFSSLVNQQQYSDVLLRTAQWAPPLYAHRVILAVRCPALLQMQSVESGEVDLSDWSGQCVLALLRFVYAGEMQVDPHVLPDTLRLAERLGLASFAQMCRSQVESFRASKIALSGDGSREEDNEHLMKQSVCSDSPFTEAPSVDVEDDRKGEPASSTGEDCEELGPPVLELCPPVQSSSPPPDIEFMDITASAELQGDSDHKQPVRHDHAQSPSKLTTQVAEGPEDCPSQYPNQTGMMPSIVDESQRAPPEGKLGAKKVVQVGEGPEDFPSQKETGVSCDDSWRVATEKSLQATPRASLIDADRVREGEGLPAAALRDTAGWSVSTECDDQHTDHVKEVGEESFDDGDISINTASSEEEGDTRSSPFPRRSQLAWSDDAHQFISLQRKKASEHQPGSADSENVKAVVINEMLNKNSTYLKRASLGRSLQNSEPVDSIEISDDDDLFSSEDDCVSLIPTSPLPHGTKQNSGEEDAGKDNSWECGFAREAGKKPLSMPAASESVQRNHREFPGKRCGEDDRYEKTRTENICCFTADQQLDKHKHLQADFEDNLSSVSLSTIEYSHQRLSPSSPKCGLFQTSTPDVPSEGGLKLRTVSKVKEKHGAQETCSNKSYSALDISTSPRNRFSKSPATFTQHKDRQRDSRKKGSDDESLQHKDPRRDSRKKGSDDESLQHKDPRRDSRKKGSDDESLQHKDPRRDSRKKGSDDESVVSKPGKEQTPCVSVVEQDSLYVTPAVEEKSERRTFQLVTPLPQQTGDDGGAFPPHTPVSHCAAKKPASVHSVSSSDSCAIDAEKETDRKNHLPEGSSLQEQLCVKNLSAQLERKEDEGCSFMGGGSYSDSDLEIIDSSIQHPPSPKFGTQSKVSSSQSLSLSQSERKTLTPPLPASQPRAPPKSDRFADYLPELSPTNDPSPKKVSSQSPYQSPSKAASSPSQQLERHWEFRSSHRSSHSPFKASPSPSRASPKASPSPLRASPGPSGVSPKASHSPSKASPCGSWDKGFSQKSAESDKELLRVTELMCVEEGQHRMGGTEQDGALPDGGTADTNRSTEEIWDRFDNLEDYNPDLYWDVIETDTDMDPGALYDGKKTPSPQASPKPPSKSPSKTAKASPFKTPAVTTKKSKESPASSKSAGKASSPARSRGRSPQRPTVSRRAYREQGGRAYRKQDTPVKFRTSALDIPQSSKTACGEMEARSASSSGMEGSASMDSSTHSSWCPANKGDGGFLLDDEDTEAFNCSFLWSEENAPTEGGGSGGDDAAVAVMRTEEAFGLAVLDLGREETVASQGMELVRTPIQMRQTEKKGGKPTWVPPSPFTPMPVYDDMSTPQLKNEVGKYGLKPVGKKRMKLVLKDIYHKTHRYETDSDCNEEDSDYVPNLGPPVLMREATLEQPTHTTQQQQQRQQQQQQAPVLHRECSRLRSRGSSTDARAPPMLPKQPKKKKNAPPVLGAQRQEEPPVLCKEADPNSRPGKSRPKTKRGLAQKTTDSHKAQRTNKAKHNSQEIDPAIQLGLLTIPLCWSPSKESGAGGGRQRRVDMESPTSSSPEKGISSSQDSDASERPDMSVFEEGRADSDDGEEITPSQQLAAKDVPQKLMAFIQSNPDLYHKVLTYEPLDLGVLKDDLKAAGIRCAQEKLINFLNEKCITFTTKNMIPRKQGRQRRKPQSKKGPASQKK